jgi:hypothetical protein
MMPGLSSRNEVGPILERRRSELEGFFDGIFIAPAANPTCHLVQKLQRADIGEQMDAPEAPKMLQHLPRDVTGLRQFGLDAELPE